MLTLPPARAQALLLQVQSIATGLLDAARGVFGLPTFFARLIPLVELQWDTPLDGDDKRTTGTWNPGIIYAGKSFEVGVEAIVPMTSHSGKNVGVRALLHFFLDDIWPAVFRPILN